MLPTGNIEVWLGEVERRMKASIRTQVSNRLWTIPLTIQALLVQPL